jgi:hypothetical protein
MPSLSKADKRAMAFLMIPMAVSMVSYSLRAQNEPGIRNIVLVHGAWADGSGWKGVYDILVKDG